MVTVQGFQQVAVTQFWSIWAQPAFYSANRMWFTPAALAYPDRVVQQLRTDFGFDIFPIPSGGHSFDGVHMDLVLDPASAGGAHTGSVFGDYGITLSPDSITGSYNGISQFWWTILSTHETVNVWTGVRSSGWPWANGSPIWLGGSQFPNMCDIVVTRELGLAQVSQAQAARELPLPGVSALYNVQRTLGWFPYQVMFGWVRTLGVVWDAIVEPVRSGLLVLILAVSGAGTVILSDLQKNGIAVPLGAVLEAQTLYSALPVLFSAVRQNAALIAMGGALLIGGGAAALYWGRSKQHRSRPRYDRRFSV